MAYDFTREAKYNLAQLKAELRFRDIPATETGILEVLVNGASIESLARAYKRYPGN